MTTSSFPALLQGYFMDRLLGQFGASPHTVAGHRDMFRLLLRFAATRTGRAPSEVRLEDLDASFVSAFLDHLEAERRNCTRTRNTRLAALRTFFRYVALCQPDYALQCQRVLAIPTKRHQRSQVEFLSEEESDALVAAPDQGTWIGRRDHTLLLLAIQTGLRNSELRWLKHRDVELGTGSHVRCLGKGRKMRCTPLQPDVAEVVKRWMAEQGGGAEDPVFPSSRGGSLSADALQRLVRRHAATAGETCPTLAGKRVTPHTLRHTTAMTLLWRGVDLTVIALWLGHESTETTQIYLHADMRLKEQALAHASPTGLPPERFEPTDGLIEFLESL